MQLEKRIFGAEHRVVSHNGISSRACCFQAEIDGPEDQTETGNDAEETNER